MCTTRGYAGIVAVAAGMAGGSQRWSRGGGSSAPLRLLLLLDVAVAAPRARLRSSANPLPPPHRSPGQEIRPTPVSSLAECNRFPRMARASQVALTRRPASRSCWAPGCCSSISGAPPSSSSPSSKVRSICGITFTFTNRCGDTVWPGLLSGSGTPPLETTGFALAPGQLRSLYAPQGWSGRFWGRSGCTFNASGKGSCATGDCGSGEVECRGAGASPPATLAGFTLDDDGGKDFYDVSLVDGYNLPFV
uniref:Thaumatin-like protein 1 n=1 Tax=Zea mays TaxID=4577 RepID=A0A804UJB4_MAIZE